MTDEQEKRSALREEAASWFAAMQGPDAKRREGEFKTWLAADPSHRTAYARIAEIYSMGKSLLSAPAGQPNRPAPRRNTAALAAVVAVIICAASVFLWMPGNHEERRSATPQQAQVEDEAIVYKSRIGEIRKVRLADGSDIILDTDSIVSAHFTSATRFLRLERGIARFEGAREKRPFIVSVGDAQVTAHGTIFDVGFRSDRTYFVRLLRGSVDVAQKLRGPTNRPSRTPRLLTPGQVVEAGLFGVRDLPPSFAPASGESWTSKMRQFDNVRVADLIDEANRYSRVQIRQPIAEVANLRASGTFAIDDPRRLATNLSLLFGLKVTEMPGEAIALSPSEIKISHSEEQTP